VIDCRLVSRQVRWLAALALLLSSLAGCVAWPSSQPTQPASPAATPATPVGSPTPGPQPGGSATIGFVGTLADLNPAFDPEGLAATLLRPVVEGLISFAPDGQPHAWLAESVPAPHGGVSDDGRVVIFRLRQGIAWEDGQPFTADDLVFTYHAYRDPTNPFTDAARAPYQMMQAVDALDAYTVRVAYSQPAAPYLHAFTMIFPAHLFNGQTHLTGAPYNRAPFGTGPFRVQEWVPGDHLTLVRSSSYRDSGRPYLDAIVYRPFATLGAAEAALRAGTIDLLLEPTTQAPSGVRAGPSSRSLHGLLPAPDQPVTWNSADWWRKP
jgi:peptide/nickel transport system substrate-binding protein